MERPNAPGWIPAFAGTTAFKPLSHRERGWGEGRGVRCGGACDAWLLFVADAISARSKIKMDSSFRWNDDDVVHRRLRAWVPAFAGMTPLIAPLPTGEGLG